MRLSTSTCLFPRASIIESMDLCYASGFRVLDANFCAAGNPKSSSPLVFSDWEQRIYDIRNHAEKLGVTFVQSHSPYNSNLWSATAAPTAESREWFIESNRRSIIASAMLGVKWVVTHAQTDTLNEEWDNAQNIKTNLEFYAWQIELAKKHGIGIAIENMAEFEPQKIKRRYTASVSELIELIDVINDPSVGACWDFGHAQMVYKNQVSPLKKLGSRLKATHVQENNGIADSHLIPFIGGNTKWIEILHALKEINYMGEFCYECHGFMAGVPKDLQVHAGKFAFEMGMYLVNYYNNL